MSDWTYQGAVFAPSDDELNAWEGFIYLVTHKTTGMKYLGRKCFWQRRKPKGKTRRVTSESDWKRYGSSHATLKADFRKNPDDYAREILFLCKTVGEMTFRETSELFKRDAITSPDYVNDNIGGKFFRERCESYLR